MIELVFYLMVAPSPSDYDLEVNSEFVAQFSTEATCNGIAQAFNDVSTDTGEHHWCLPVVPDDT